VTNLIVNGINMASMQHSDVVSVVQRNSGHVQALLVVLRDKECEQRYPPIIAVVSFEICASQGRLAMT
jgi:hypothetical protein